MINQDTINVWMAEFNRMSDLKDKTSNDYLKYMLEIQKELFTNEPYFVAYVSMLVGTLSMNNPLSISFFILSIYKVLIQRQEEADKLGKQII